MKITNNIRLQLVIQKVIFISLLLIACGLLAWLSQQHSVQYDWTKNRQNTLSKSSIDLLLKMDGPIVVNIYTRYDDTVKMAIEELLTPYMNIKSDFSFSLINPDTDIDWRQKTDISREGEIIVSYRDRKDKAVSLGEQAISSSILRLSRTSVQKVIYLQGHGELSPTDNNNYSFSLLSEKLDSSGITSTTHTLLSSPLPEDISTLVIAGPTKPFIDGEIEHIKTYLSRGGNLLWLMDPGDTQNLDEVSKQLGITFMEGVIVDNNTDLRATLRIESPAIIPVIEYHLHPITKNMSNFTVFTIARGIKYNNVEEWKATSILAPLERSWAETDALNNEATFEPTKGDIPGPITLGMALERTLTKGEKAPMKISQRVVVIGDSNFLTNSYIGYGANMSQGLNIMNWLVGDDDPVSIDIKRAPDTELQLSPTDILFIGLGFLLVIPSALIFTGFIIWSKRRRQ
jgi:ABC-type uncharacterized transport system involved in gliding motility auxiliary subunit